MGFIVMLCMINVKTANAQLRRNILSIFAPVRRRKSPHTKRARRNQSGSYRIKKRTVKTVLFFGTK